MDDLTLDLIPYNVLETLNIDNSVTRKGFYFNKYRITRLDDKNLLLEELVERNKRDSTKVKEYEFRGYYGRMSHCLYSLLNKYMLDSSDVKDLYLRIELLERFVNNNCVKIIEEDETLRKSMLTEKKEIKKISKPEIKDNVKEIDDVKKVKSDIKSKTKKQKNIKSVTKSDNNVDNTVKRRGRPKKV